MKFAKQQGWKLIGALSVLLITFTLGYWVGSNKQTAQVEAVTSLTTSDMEHAFGQIAESTQMPAQKQGSKEEPMAKSLNDLLAGLEQKVAADPENIDQQLLLAQTYNELDQRQKGLQLLHKLSEKYPNNAQVKIILATVLMKGENKIELQESMKAFDAAIKLKPDVAKMAQMYQDEIRAHLKSLNQ